MSEPYESRKATAVVYPFVKGCEVYSCHFCFDLVIGNGGRSRTYNLTLVRVALPIELLRSDLYMWKLRCCEFFAYLVITGPFATGGHDSTRHPSLFGISSDGSFLP